MTTYYLYVKTHSRTGLKYLGFTSRDPQVYCGSGKYWKSHLKIHGKDHTTEVIKECRNKKEIRKWGRYYSELWNVVDSNEWANLKPEEADGSPSGSRNQNYRPEKFTWQHKVTGEIIVATRLEMRKKFGINEGHLTSVLNKTVKSAKGWALKGTDHTRRNLVGDNNPMKKQKSRDKLSGKNHYLYDDKVYTWQHVVTGEIEHLTQNEIRKKYNISNITGVLRGINKTAKGWTLQK